MMKCLYNLVDDKPENTHVCVCVKHVYMHVYFVVAKEVAILIS